MEHVWADDGVYALTVNDASGAVVAEAKVVVDNLPPVFTTSGAPVAVPEATYRYEVAAEDPGDAEVTLALVQGPEGMAVAEGEGFVLEWTPGVDASGIVSVVVSATDDDGATALQKTAVQVLDEVFVTGGRGFGTSEQDAFDGSTVSSSGCATAAGSSAPPWSILALALGLSVGVVRRRR